ncbi:MAG TPA: amidase [Steroidobacter sp.]
MSPAPFDLSISEMGAALRGGRLSSATLVESALSRIADYDSHLKAFIRVDAPGALQAAHQADRELANGYDRGPLHGVPYAIKDICDVAGEPTTCNSRVRAGHVAQSDSTVVERMRTAGAILLGKLNLTEFCTGGPGDEWPHPPPRNPWNTAHITGGSSSGAGVAVAARYIRLAIGTDSGGSLRLPAAYCGGVGFKPTFGRVSHKGIFPLSESLDHCGPLARSVEDAAIGLQAIAGFDPADRLSSNVPVGDYIGSLRLGVRGLRIGIPADHFNLIDHLDPAVAASLDRTRCSLADAGAIVTTVSLPDLGAFRAAGMAIMLAEAFAVHREDLRTRLTSYSQETAQRFLQGAGVSQADLTYAWRHRRRLTQSIDRIFQSCDVILTASTVSGAGMIGSMGDMMATPRRIALLPFNVTGHPAIHVPMSTDSSGLPVGVQLVSARFAEETLLRAASFVEACGAWPRIAFPALDKSAEEPTRI